MILVSVLSNDNPAGRQVGIRTKRWMDGCVGGDANARKALSGGGETEHLSVHQLNSFEGDCACLPVENRACEDGFCALPVETSHSFF
mmetsp:Transcript_44376/g.87684  ORF Transcript_44376/g.87684 Transcript_44376/m.87684 type:complete len:87 (+) Transcript_44376:704-964(+)